MKRRMISLLLALALIITCLPQLSLPARAANDDFVIDKNGVLTEYNGSGGAVVIPSSVTSIGPLVFYHCTNLTSVTIPDSVTSIRIHAFTYCTSLTSLIIPDSVTSIDDYAFVCCTSLTSVTLSNSITRIGQYTFDCCISLTNVTIPDSVTKICDYAFSRCNSLTSVTIPKSVTSIGGYAFNECTAIKEVYYSGSPKDWGKISIGSDNDPLLNATIHYNSGGNTNPGGSVTCKDGHNWEYDDPDQFRCKSCGRVESVSPVLGYSFQKDSFQFSNDDVASYDISEVGYQYMDRFLKIDIISFITTRWNEIKDLIKDIKNFNKDTGKHKIVSLISIISDLKRIKEPRYSGACFGISAMNSSFYRGMQTSLFGADSARELSIDSASPDVFNQDTKLKDAINIMFLSQSSLIVKAFQNLTEAIPGGQLFGEINAKKMVKIAKEMRRGDYPPLVCFNLEVNGKDYDHCVSIIGIEPDDFNKDYYCITTYDSNSPDMPSLLYIKKDYSGATYNKYFAEENIMKGYTINEISYFITSSMFNIDFWAPGLSISPFYFVNKKSIRSEKSKSLQTEEQAEIEKLEKRYIAFSVAAEDEVEIRSSKGKKVIIAGSEVIYSDYSEIYRVPFVGISMTRVIIPYDAEEYTLTCKGKVTAHINYNHNIATTYLDSGGTVKYSAAGKVSYCPRTAGAYSEGAYYRADLIHDSDIIGCGTQGNTDSAITIDCSSGDVLLSGKDIASQELFIQHDNYEMTVDTLAFDENQSCNSIVVDSPDGKQVQVKYKQSDKSGSFRFDDVKNEKAFYYDAVYWAYNAEPQITNGIDKTHFGPDQGCTRGQVVTFLWRAAGCPDPNSTKTKFKDVGEKAFYAKAVAWAVEQGITKGMSADKFAPDATCTRGQIVTFLWRAGGSSKAVTASNPFGDVSKTAFYYPAMLWAVENGVTTGTSKTTFAPDATCTRGQIVTFLYRSSQKKPSSKFKKENYEIVISNDSWEKALAAAKKKGGKLVSFESREEYRFVLELIEKEGKINNVFYSLGGRRDENGKDYFWADADNKLYGGKINGSDAWCADCWEPGEPNLVYNSRPETIAMMYYKSAEARWVWYDASATFRNSKKTYGYIIEYGN